MALFGNGDGDLCGRAAGTMPVLRSPGRARATSSGFAINAGADAQAASVSDGIDGHACRHRQRQPRSAASAAQFQTKSALGRCPVGPPIQREDTRACPRVSGETHRCPKFGTPMRRGGRARPDAVHRWTGRAASLCPRGHVQTRQDRMRRPGGDALTTPRCIKGST